MLFVLIIHHLLRLQFSALVYTVYIQCISTQALYKITLVHYVDGVIRLLPKCIVHPIDSMLALFSNGRYKIMTGLIQYVMNKYDSTLDECLREADYTEEIFALSIIQQHMPRVNYTRVCVVNNVFLRALYELKKEEYKSRYGSVSQMTLIHATSESNVDSIIQNNFDWRMVHRNKYGMGISFTDDADYANYHSNPVNGDARAFIIALVLVHSSSRGSQGLLLPSGGADTAKSDTNKVYVKFNDNEFLPLYVVYYNAPDKTQSKHHLFSKRRGSRRHHSLGFF